MKLDGVRVAITGASSGIGAAAARVFASHGAEVHLAARRKERLEAVAAECEAFGVRAFPYVLDVTDAEATRRWAAAVEAVGPCDVAIANAGVMWLGPLLDMADDEVNQQIDVNVRGVLHVLRSFGKPMRQRNRGVLMPVSSVLSVAALPRYAAYCATKYAVRALATSLRYELADSGVDVVHVLPGATESELHSRMSPERLPASTRQAKRVPPEQVADAMVRALASRPPEVLCDRQGRLLYWASRHMPGLLDTLLPRVIQLRGRKRT